MCLCAGLGICWILPFLRVLLCLTVCRAWCLLYPAISEGLTVFDCVQGLVFRCVECESGVQPHAMAQFGVPTDFVDLSTGQDPFKLMDLMQLVSPPGDHLLFS